MTATVDVTILAPLSAPLRQSMRLTCAAIAAGTLATASTFGISFASVVLYWIAAAVVVFVRLSTMHAQPKERWILWWGVAIGFSVALWAGAIAVVAALNGGLGS